MLLKINSTQKIIAYKILNNLLATIAIVWILGLLAEALIPGFISAYFSFSKIILIVFILTLLIYLLGKNFEIKNPVAQKDIQTRSPKLFFSITLLSILIISLGALHTSLIPLLIITAIFLAILYFIHQEIK